MHTKIAEFPSKVMYDSRLITHTSVAAHLLRDLPNITTTSDDGILETPVVFFDTAGCEYFEKLEGEGDEGSRCNENEATIVHNWVESLVRDSVLAKRLGLTVCAITPRQARLQLGLPHLKLEYSHRESESI
jgi:DNA polymerase alpha-associated DNA helicase A